MDRTTILIDGVGLVLIALACVITPYLNVLRRFTGYSELRSEVRAIGRFLRGEIFRDGNDLVISGNVQGRRTTVRFSQAENTPGVNLRMEVPATFDLAIAPRTADVVLTGQLLRTGNDAFDAKWIVRTNERTQARIFLAGDLAMREIQKLCCCSTTFVHVESGVLEVSELVVPQVSPGRHLMGHAESMAILGKQLGLMPGATQVKVDLIAPPRRTSRVLAVVIAVIVVCMGIATLANYERDKTMKTAETGFGGSPLGIPSDEAVHIPNLAGWRLSTSPDFDPSLVEWLRKSHVQPAGRLDGDFQGGGPGSDHAYLLMNSEGGHRLVVMVGDQVWFDENYPGVVLVAKVPKSAIRNISIRTGSPATGETDGILLVRDKDDLHSGLVLSFNGPTPVLAVPEDYKSTTVE